MSYSSEVLADSPLAYWRLGDASGTTMTDSSGNARNGSYVGTYTLGATGLLTGDSDTALGLTAAGCGQAGTFAAWMTPTAWTCEALIKPSTVSGNQTIVAMYTASSGSATRFTFRLTNNVPSFYVWVGATPHGLSSTGTVSAGTIYHTVATYDGSTAQIFLNGALAGSGVLGVTPNTGSSPVTVGATVSAVLEKFAGTIDEAAYYGSVLSSTRIAAHYAAATAGGGVTPRGAFREPAPLRRQAVIRASSY